MERDFLGAIGKEAKEESRGSSSRQDAAFMGGSAMQWPFAGWAGPLPPIMSFKSVQEHESKELLFDQFSLSGFRSASEKQTPVVLPPQKQFGVDSQGIQQQYAMLGHRAQGMDSFGAPNHLMSETRMIPVASHHMQSAPSHPMFKVQSTPNLPNAAGSSFKQQPFGGGIGVNNAAIGSTVGVFGHRDMPKPAPKAAQLTIFYAGSVNVFDNIPLDKAQEIVSLASKASSMSPAIASRKLDSAIFTPAKVAIPDASLAKPTPGQKQDHAAPPGSSTLSSPVSVVSQTGTLLRCGSSSVMDSAGPRYAGPLVPTSQHEPASAQPAALAAPTEATAVPRAVPQARKASLARFLEKRKERVASVVPYATAKNSLEGSDAFGSANTQSKSSCTDMALLSNCDESLCSSKPGSSSYSGESPSTKLQI